MSLDLNEIKRLLDSRDVNDRKRAILLIADSGHTDLLPYLAALYKTDPDEEIRQLAVEAGRRVKKSDEIKKQEERKWEGKPPREDAPADDKPKRVEVSLANEKKSFEMMDRALNLSLSGDGDKAKDLARQAFKANPNLQLDPYYKGMLGEIFGTHPDSAMDALNYGGGKPKRKNSEEGSSDDNWGAAIGDLIIYTLVSMATVIIGFFALVSVLQNPMQNFVAIMEADPEFRAMMEMEGMSSLTGISELISVGSIFFIVITGVITGISALINLMFVNLFYHLSAQFLLGGEGSFVRLIRKTTNFYTVITVIAFAAGIGVVYLMFSQFANVDWVAAEAAMRDGGSYNYTYTLDSSDSLSGMILALTCGGTLFALFALFRTANLIGQAYDFGTGRGCLTMILGSIGLMVVGGVINAVIVSLVLGAFLPSMMSLMLL